jgi:hypothetical protein
MRTRRYGRGEGEEEDDEEEEIPIPNFETVSMGVNLDLS